MNDCIFCKIVEKTIPAKIIYEDEHCLAFEDIQPQAPVHVLIIPQKHVYGILDPNNCDILPYLWDSLKKLAQSKKIDVSGFRVVINSGSDGNQTVAHLHLHLMGGRAMHWPPG
jgi:histidine triad (HIT) family protein